MIIKNYLYLIFAHGSRWLGKGKYYRKRMFCCERILTKNFPVQSKFCFVQVGANDGKSFDFLYSFVTKRQSSGVVIEPILDYFTELCENYSTHPAIIKVNKAVYRTKQTMVLYKVQADYVYLYPAWVKGIASFDLSHLTKFDFINRDHIIKEEVIAEPLMEIIERVHFTDIDYFQVDAEGYDYEVLNMLDFREYKPKFIKLEYVNLQPLEKEKIKKKLTSNGYHVFFEDLDIVGMDLKRIAL